ACTDSSPTRNRYDRGHPPGERQGAVVPTRTRRTGSRSHRRPCFFRPTRAPAVFGNFRIIDLSVPLQHKAVSEPLPAQIHYVRHDGEGLHQMQHFFGVKAEDLVWSARLPSPLHNVRAPPPSSPP